MNRLFIILLVVLAIGAAQAAEHKMIPRYNRLTKQTTLYPEVSIHDLQFCPPESLHIADSLQTLNQTTRWTVQASPYSVHGDTVVIVAVIVVASASDDPHHGIIYTQHGWNMLLHDTSGQNSWAGIFCRVGSTGGIPDTADARSEGFNAVSRGDVVRITGWIGEFPTQSMNSSTQITPIPGIAIELVEPNRADLIPAPSLLPVSTFNGQNTSGEVHFSTGEQYEESLVKFAGLTVNAIVNVGRGTWNMSDGLNNNISDYDISYYWTIGSSETPPITGDPAYTTPPLGGTIDTIQGSIWTASGGENSRGYRLTPLFAGDVQYGVTLPFLSTHRRYPVIVTANDTVIVTAKAQTLVNGYPIASLSLFVSVNNTPYQSLPMTSVGTDSFQATIWDGDHNPYPDGTNIHYFIKAFDDHGNSNIYVNAGGSPFDSSSGKGFFFYDVIDRPLTIHDVQYTPYRNGRSPYVGGSTTIRGIVTASDSDISITSLTTGGTSSWYIQTGNQPWNGIWVVKDTLLLPPLDSLKRGDSVMISGKIQENFDVTRIADSVFTIVSHGNPIPAPIDISTGTFPANTKINGDTTAERYEGMLVRVKNATLDNDTITFSDATEYSIDDGSGPMIVRRDGVNKWSNVEADTTIGKSILHIGDQIDTLVGVGYFSFNYYKIVPRRNDDFFVGKPLVYPKGWNMVSVSLQQQPAINGYEASSLFPGASSSAFAYQAGYVPTTTLANGPAYWLKFPAATTVYISGKQIAHDTIYVSKGWNMVGSTAKDVSTAGFTVRPAGNSLSPFYGFTSGYTQTSTLKPGFGYWVKSDSDGYFVESFSGSAPKGMPQRYDNTITFSDNHGDSQSLYFVQDDKGEINLKKYEMPPAYSPTGFDVRYESGRILETFGGPVKTSQSFGIAARSKDPMTLKYDVARTDGKYAIDVVVNGTVVKTIELKGNGTVANLPNGKLVLRVTAGKELPREFSLSQNYPNPFNPTTKFEVALPVASRLEVVVYNILGQKVNTLVNETRDAGVHSIVWNGTEQNGNSVSTGVYFVRMMAGKFTQVRKIMLMK